MYQNRGTLSTAWLRPEPLGAYNAGLKRGTAREGREEEGKKEGEEGKEKGEVTRISPSFMTDRCRCIAGLYC